jgi:RNA polymerase sigma factor (sigma-70 family)
MITKEVRASGVASACRVFGKNWQDAEDAVQEASIKVLRNGGTFDHLRTASFKTWFNRVARNSAIDLLRAREAPCRRTAQLDAGLPYPSDLPSPGDRAELTDEVLRVRAAVARLTPRLRDVAELFYLQELTGREVAARLGIPLGTVRSRSFAALIRLKEELG